MTFSDQPPPAATGAKVSAATAGGSGGAAPTGLPFELRQIASKYPVTLYSGNDCGPCGTAKSMLVNRGIPFSERTVITSEDFKALQRLSGDTSLPFATIGGQQLKGFSDVEWTQFLNAAGYPAASVLPSSYRPPAATPLVAIAAPSPPRATAQPAPAAAARHRWPLPPAAIRRLPSTVSGDAHSRNASELGFVSGSGSAYFQTPGISTRRFAFRRRKRGLEHQRLDAARRAQQAHMGFLEGEHPHRHHARPLADLRSRRPAGR